MKIMLVDDSRTMRATQKKALAQLGHKDINGYPISIPRLTTVCSRSGARAMCRCPSFPAVT